MHHYKSRGIKLNSLGALDLPTPHTVHDFYILGTSRSSVLLFEKLLLLGKPDYFQPENPVSGASMASLAYTKHTLLP